MNRRLLVLSAALLAKLLLLALPLLSMASFTMGAARDCVTPLAAWAGVLALGLGVYFLRSAAVDAADAAGILLKKEALLVELPDWKRLLPVVLAALCVLHPIRAWHYLLGMVGRNELTQAAALVDAWLSTNHHLVVFIVALVVALAVPALREMTETIHRWQVVLAGVFLLGLACWCVQPMAGWMRAQAMDSLQSSTGGVVTGREGWLFDECEVEALTSHAATENDASDAVLRIAAKLKESGVPLLMIPIPMKASIYPEFITGSDPDAGEAPIYQSKQPGLYEQWAKAGIDVQDITSAMLQAKERKTQVFLKQDAFWTPDMMQALAKAIAGHVKKQYPAAAAADPLIVDAKARDVSAGPVPRLIQRRGSLAPDLPEEVSLVLSFPSIENDPTSPVLVVGGNEVRIFDEPSLGYVPRDATPGTPTRAGFAQHLALYLGRSVESLALENGAAEAGKALLGRGKESLQTKKLAIWLVPVVDLLLGKGQSPDWEAVR